MTTSASVLKAKSLDLRLEFDFGDTIFDQLGIKDGLESFMGPLELKNSNEQSTPTDFIANVEREYDIDFIVKSFPSTYGLGSKISFNLAPSIFFSTKVSLKSGKGKFFLPSGISSFIDPISIENHYRNLSLTNAILIKHNIFNNSVGFLEFGHMRFFTKVKSNISSSLLDIKTLGSHSFGGWFFTLGHRNIAKPMLQPKFTYKRYESGSIDFSLSLDVVKNF
jgi:hypothetical protein